MAVQDIVDPGAPSNPIENPDLTQFKSIEDLFDIIAERFQTVDLMYLRLDETLHFPAWTFIDHLYDAADDEITYYVKDVERLE